ncbi:hypothetical protein FOCC_FOCC011155 [Frankliniella occidentalis]|nr:hypothetical protein FOCC_FOCC011155 [Frankliniella occidentalis]
MVFVCEQPYPTKTIRTKKKTTNNFTDLHPMRLARRSLEVRPADCSSSFNLESFSGRALSARRLLLPLQLALPQLKNAMPDHTTLRNPPRARCVPAAVENTAAAAAGRTRSWASKKRTACCPRKDEAKLPPVFFMLRAVQEVLDNGSLYFPPFPAQMFRTIVHAVAYRCRAANAVGVIVSRDCTVRAGLAEGVCLVWGGLSPYLVKEA